MIKEKCSELLPKWLRFVKGVIDCDSLPLNVSRETAQDSQLLNKLNDLLTKRILRLLKDEADKDASRYISWYREFNIFIKEGLATTSQNQQVNLKELLIPLLRSESSFGSMMIGLDEYIKNMKENQKSIYTLLSKNKLEAEKSPYLEIFKKNNIPVL